MVFFFKGKTNRLAQNIFKWLFRRYGLKCARLWDVTISQVTCHGLTKSPCSKMQWSPKKLLGTPAAVLACVSVICTRSFKDGKRIDILGHCMCNHQMVPSILERPHAAPASSAQGLGKLAAGWDSHSVVLCLQRTSSDLHGISDCTSLTNSRPKLRSHNV